jgi:tetratricopeptide (TPR) repeat protein
MENNEQSDLVLSGFKRILLCALAAWLIISLSHPAFAQENGDNESSQPKEDASAPATPTLSFQDRADIFMARKQFADAADYYLRAIRTEKDGQAALWNKLGISYQQQEKFNEARDAYKKAIHYDKTMPEPWNNMGTTYFLQNKAKKSLKYYRHAVKLNPNVASFHMNLGTGYYRTKKYEIAVSEYRAALILDPDILIRHSMQGTVVDARGGGAKLFFYLAKAFASLGRSDEAIRYLRRAFEEGFDNKELLSKDPDFQKISSNPAYVELINNPPIAIKE